MLSKNKVKTWINTVTNKFRKPPKTQGLHIPIQYTQQRTNIKPIIPKQDESVRVIRLKRYVFLRGLSGGLVLLNLILGGMSISSANFLFAIFFLVNAWLIVYAYKYAGRKT